MPKQRFIISGLW